jgi:L-cysteine/cystine lyase
MPIQLIREGTRERNIPMLVDGAQGAGQVEADLSALDVDFYALPGQKWLLGPEGVGALYVRRDRIADLEARDGSRHSGRYDALSGELQWETGMRKFFTSTGSAVVRAGLCAALDLVREVGVPAIAARNRSLASRLKAGLRDQPGVAVYTPPDPPSSAGIVTLAVQGMRGTDTVKALRERCGIISRPIEPYQAARLSIHAFNTEDEIDRAAEAILELARGGLSG